jgi:ABC-type transport system substrate-binding protein
MSSNQTVTRLSRRLGHFLPRSTWVGRPAGSIIPSTLQFALPLEPFPYNPAQARRLLAEAGYPHGFEAGDLNPIPPFFTLGEAVGNYLAAVGIRTQMRTMERAAFLSAWRDKKLKGLIVTGSCTPRSLSLLRCMAWATGGGAGGRLDPAVCLLRPL